MLKIFFLVLIIMAILTIIFIRKVAALVGINFQPTVPSSPEYKIPDSPVAFGFHMMWFAVKTENTKGVAKTLGLINVSECNWKGGIEEANNGFVFVTPAIDGWTLACGWGLPHGDSQASIKEVKRILKLLSKEFGEAQYFCTDNETHFHGWFKSVNGNIERVFSMFTEHEGLFTIEGQPTDIEITLNTVNPFSEETDAEYFADEEIVFPDEDLLMQVAEVWSINPTKLEERQNIGKGLGLLGQMSRKIFS